MNFIKDNIYHIYNRGNNSENTFYHHGNYIYFLKKIRQYLLPNSDFLAYCLMPNHFHFLILANDQTVLTKNVKGDERNAFSEGIRIMLSSYTQAINNQENRKGSLFSQNTKCKCLTSEKEGENYPFICFNYIHQNPLRAKLVNRLEDWEYSSYKDYADLRRGTLCNQSIAKELIGYDDLDFSRQSYQVISEEVMEKIF